MRRRSRVIVWYVGVAYGALGAAITSRRMSSDSQVLPMCEEQGKAHLAISASNARSRVNISLLLCCDHEVEEYAPQVPASSRIGLVQEGCLLPMTETMHESDSNAGRHVQRDVMCELSAPWFRDQGPQPQGHADENDDVWNEDPDAELRYQRQSTPCHLPHPTGPQRYCQISLVPTQAYRR